MAWKMSAVGGKGAAEKAALMQAYKPLQKHQVTLSIPGWLNSLAPGRFQFDFR